MPVAPITDEGMHAARLVALDGAARSLLGEACSGEHPHDAPDGLRVTLTPEGLEIEFLRGDLPVAGEFV